MTIPSAPLWTVIKLTIIVHREVYEPNREPEKNGELRFNVIQ